jgi:hypothetical protein
LIVCEGEKTEPEYFRAYRVMASVISVDVRGAAGDPMRVVQTAREEHDKAARLYQMRKPYDQIWCVFDRDDVPAHRFRQAIDEAHRLGVRVAYSNQAFELWYLLHFHFVNTAMPRSDYIAKLNSLLPDGYSKNSRTIYRNLQDKQETAIQFAAKLLALYPAPNPERDDPSTTVHLLIKELNRFRL